MMNYNTHLNTKILHDPDFLRAGPNRHNCKKEKINYYNKISMSLFLPGPSILFLKFVPLSVRH